MTPSEQFLLQFVSETTNLAPAEALAKARTALEQLDADVRKAKRIRRAIVALAEYWDFEVTGEAEDAAS